MPYINKEERKAYDDHINALLRKLNAVDYPEGHVNYILSKIILGWFKKHQRYATIAKITGVLENVKQEFYRRHAGLYEDKAIEKNGDI